MYLVEQAQKRPWHLYKIDTKTLIYFILSSHIHACAGFKLYCNSFIINRDFLNQSANQLLIVFRNVLLLFGKELLHFADLLFHTLTLCTRYLSILLCLSVVSMVRFDLSHISHESSLQILYHIQLDKSTIS